MTELLIPVPRGPHVREIDKWNAVRYRDDYLAGKLCGAQDPRLWYSSPADDWTEGVEACEFADQKGWPLDPWQEWCLKQSMGTVAGLKWSAFEVGLIVSRQNGKNQIAEIRELAGLFLINEALIIHTAHEFKASVEQFRRLRAKIEDDDWMRKQVKTITTSHGDEAIELLPRPTLIMGSGSKMVKRSVAPRLRFLARSGGSGRSFTCNLLVWDEAMILTKEQVGAAMPTLSAVPNPQLWYMGSAGNEASVQLAQIRSRGVKGDAKRRAGLPYTDEAGQPISLFYAEYSIDYCNEYCVLICPDHPDTTECLYSCSAKCYQHDDPEDPVSWARANPGLGNRISIQHVRREMASMAPNGVVTSPADVFARERLGVGRWPADEDGWAVISEAAWDSCADEDSPRPLAPFCIAVDVTPNQEQSSIAIVGRRADGKLVVEIAEGHHRAGTAWVIPELVRLQRELSKISPRNKPCAVIIDKSGPAGMLMNDAVNKSLAITNPNTNEAGQAFETFYTGIQDQQIVHLGEEINPDLRSAVAGAARREIGDGGYAWARRDSAVDISPLVACTLAVWGHGKFASNRYDVLKSISPAHDVGICPVCMRMPCACKNPPRSVHGGANWTTVDGD